MLTETARSKKYPGRESLLRGAAESLVIVSPEGRRLVFLPVGFGRYGSATEVSWSVQSYLFWQPSRTVGGFERDHLRNTVQSQQLNSVQSQFFRKNLHSYEQSGKVVFIECANGCKFVWTGQEIKSWPKSWLR